MVPPSDTVNGSASLFHDPGPSPSSIATTLLPLPPPAPPFAQSQSQPPLSPTPTTDSNSFIVHNEVKPAPPRRLPSLDDLPPLPLRPLDYNLLLSSSEGLHSQLANTVEELSQWLGAIEYGLGGVLAEAELFAELGDEPVANSKGGVVRIPEEDEDSDSAEDSLSDTAVETLAAH